MQTESHRPDSDIDLLVEFESGHEPGLIALAGMELELSEMLAGRKMDLRMPQDLSRYFRDEVQTASGERCHTTYPAERERSWAIRFGETRARLIYGGTQSSEKRSLFLMYLRVPPWIIEF